MDVNDFEGIRISIASPEKIRAWSYGEVKKAETINYRTLKPERDGLFCEKIFGPTKDFECSCGKYKRLRYKNIVCDKCGVEVTRAKVRRERMGHIELATPVSHIWFFKGVPSRMGLVLDMSPRDLEEVLYFVSYVVLDPGSAPLEKKQTISDKEYRAYYEKYGNSFRVGMGAEAIKELLLQVDIKQEVENIKEEIASIKDSASQKRVRLIKRLDVLNAFLESGNEPSWMILDALPVIPPDLRPMLQLDGGRFAASDLNELYRRVLTRNIRLKKLQEINAPAVILINEKRMLQEAVDALIDNGRRSKAVQGAGGRNLKSLSSTLKGKQGRFRQNLLGKRVDYSGRSVIAVGPELRMNQCGIPREMAVQLFKPFIEAKMMEKKICSSHKQADKLIDKQGEEVLDVLDEIIADHPVLLNRAPTLHRLGIQAFETKLVDGRAIRLHPLVCPPFNADFDGDQMAVHVPLSKDSIAEARVLMLASGNILGPKDGKPIVVPSQDMILGNYFITLEWRKEDFYKKAEKYATEGDEIYAEQYRLYGDCEGKVFANPDGVILAYQTGNIHLQTRIAIVASSLHKDGFTPEQNDSYLITTVGKVIFNSIFPSYMAYLNSANDSYDATPDKYFVKKGSNIKEIIAAMPLNDPFIKKHIQKIIDHVFKLNSKLENDEKYKDKLIPVYVILDAIKDQGFKYSTLSGVTVSVADINVVEGKQELIAEGDKLVKKITSFYKKGLLTDDERHKQIVDVWSDVKDKVEKKLKVQLQEDNRNPFFMMSDSGARGSLSNFTQLAGMRGLMSKPSKPSQKDIGKDLIAKLSQTGGKLTASELAKLSQMSAPTEKTIELPIKTCFREGLTVSEFFIATHGARKGMSDTALKTSESGYLTRRLVDVAHDVLIKEEDCHTDEGYEVREIVDTKTGSKIAPFENRLIGRYTLNNVYDPNTGELIVDNNTIINGDIAKKIIAAGITSLKIRSLFGCRTVGGVCSKCYGLNLAVGKPVEVGEAVGVMAAQSIGEPGTQLTMRTFHTGGAAGESDITTGLPRVEELFETRPPKGEAIISEISGTVTEIIDNSRFGEKTVVKVEREIDKNLKDVREYQIPIGAKLRVAKGDVVANGQKITDGPINPKELLKVSAQVDVERYILKEVQRVYALQGIPICDKHIEVMIRQMLRKLVILDGGDTNFVQGSRVEKSEFTAANKEVLLRHGRPAVATPLVLGITKSSLETSSFLSAASFQETTRVLTEAAIKGKEDHLHGLKENVIVGKLIPCVETIQNVSLLDDEDKVIEEEAIEDAFEEERTLSMNFDD